MLSYSFARSLPSYPRLIYFGLSNSVTGNVKQVHRIYEEPTAYKTLS